MHLPVLAALRDRGEVVLALICDVDQERAAAARRKFGFMEDCADGAAALERQDIDTVYIFGSAQLHYRYGLVALQNGKHLFVEKPIAPSYAEASEMAQAARVRGLIAVSGHNRRFYRSLGAVRARAGKVGWRFAEAVFHKSEYRKAPPFGARTWLGANGIHALDALVFMMNGLPEHVSALAAVENAVEPSAFSAIMRWPDGGQGVFLCNNNAGSRREQYVFHGFDETFSVTGSGLTIETAGTVKQTRLPSIGDGIAAEHDAFLQAIRSGAEPLHSIAAIAPSLYLAELIEAGFSGRVQLPLVVPARAPQPRQHLGKSILVTESAGLLPSLARLLPGYRLVSVEEVRASTGQRSDIVAAILGRNSAALPADIVAKLPQLGVLGVAGLSVGRHAPAALLDRGIVLVNASQAYAESAAEFALGLAILARRRAFTAHRNMRDGGWGTAPRISGLRGIARRAAVGLRPVLRAARVEAFFARAWRTARPLIDMPGAHVAEAGELHGATVGLIGWGAIAQLLTGHLVRAQARILVYSEHAPEHVIRQGGAMPASLGEVLAADIISLHRGLTQATRHFLGAPELAKLRPGAILINTARGALIEPAALFARLTRGDIFACLDTYDEEPLSVSHPLRQLPNVFLTPHIAGGSRDMHAAAADEVVQKVAAYLRGDAIQGISAQQLRTMT